MATNRYFSIFQHKQSQLNKQQAENMFSIIINKEQNGTTKKQAPRISKRQIYTKEIRKSHNDLIRRSRREEFYKDIERTDLYKILDQLASNNVVELQNLSSLFTHFRQKMDDFKFCQMIDQNNTIKSYIFSLYHAHHETIPIRQKSLIISSLVFLTYYGCKSLQFQQRTKMIQIMVAQIESIKVFNCEAMEYFRKIVDLITNLTSDNDQDLNNYLIQSQSLNKIVQKITQISMESEKTLKQGQNKDSHQKYEGDLQDIRESFIQTLFNLSEFQFQNKILFQFSLNEIAQDYKYLTQCGTKVVRILYNFLSEQEFRSIFIDNEVLTKWFENEVFKTCQMRFSNPESIETGQFHDIKMDQNEKQLFFWLIKCLVLWLDWQEDETFHEMMLNLIKQNLNGYCLSQFLIQSANLDGKAETNSKHASMAIQLLVYLADDREITAEQILVVTSHRDYEEVLKVFLACPYFTSFKISEHTFSLLNKLMSKDPHILKSLIELGIFDSINSFLQTDMGLLCVNQINNFIQLLILMIDSQNIIGQKNKAGENKVVRLIEQNGFLNKIQKYQDHSSSQVANKTLTFLNYFDTSSKQSNLYNQFDI